MIMNLLRTGILVFSIWTSSLNAADWPQWRGPTRDGVSTEKGLLKQWPAGGPPLAWKATGLGAGHGGVSVAGSHVFSTGDKSGSGFAVVLDKNTGKVVWTASIGKAGADPAGPRTTPTVDGSRVFVLGQFGDLVCLDTGTGKEVWRKSFEKDFSGRCGGWKYSESPLVDGERLVCTPGSAQGSMVALNKQTGAVLWQTSELTDSAEYSSPIVETIDGVRQVHSTYRRTCCGGGSRNRKTALEGGAAWRNCDCAHTDLPRPPRLRDFRLRGGV